MGEQLPDIPLLLQSLEAGMQEWTEHDDYSKITKVEMATNIECLYDALIDISKYIVASNYKIDILDKTIARKLTNDSEDLPVAGLVVEEEEDEKENMAYGYYA